MMSLLPLIHTDSLQPQESALSLLYRLSELNYYEPPGALLAYIQADVLDQLEINDRIENPRLPQTFAALSTLTRLDEQTLWQATPHTFAPVLSFSASTRLPPHNQASTFCSPLSAAVIARHIHAPTAAQFCPRCLKASAYHRVGWSLLTVTCCVKHTCLLVKQCPQCGSRVSVRDVTYDVCHQCGQRLSETKPAPLTLGEPDLFAQATIQSWFGLCNPPENPDFTPLPESSPAGLYHVMFAIQTLVRGQRIPGFTAHSVDGQPQRFPTRLSKTGTPTAAIHALFTMAFKTLTHWPKRFHTLLSAYRERPQNLEGGGLQADFGAIYSWLQRHQHRPELMFVQEAFDDYIAAHYDSTFHIRQSARYRHRPALAAKFQYLTCSEAASLLKLSPTALRVLVEAGRLTRKRSRDSTHYLFRREEIEALDAAWRTDHPIPEVARMLALEQEAVIDLIQWGLLGETHTAEESSLPSVINRRYIDLFLLGLSRYVLPWPVPEGQDVLDFDHTVQLFGTKGVGSAYVFDRVLHGAMSAFKLPDEALQPGRLWFHHLDVLACLTTIGLENRWLQPYHIAVRMRVKEQVVWRWRQRGLITPTAYAANQEYYDIDQINKFERDYAPEREAARILRISSFTLRDWAFAGKLHPVSGPSVDGANHFLFRRGEIMALREQNLPSKL